MSKKIGILTYHSAINYGAALQCYALRQALNQYSSDVSVLNLVTKLQEDNNSILKKGKGVKSIIIQIALLPFLGKRIKKNKRFEEFQNLYFNCTDRIENQDEFQELLKRLEIDTVIVGSDQVWCPSIEDFTDNFFIPFDMPITKIGYGVSIGKTEKEGLLPYKKYIELFSYIGVREKSAISVLQQVVNKELIEVVDPTLLLTRQKWLSMVEKIESKKISKPYMICYFLKKEQFNVSYQLAKKIAREKGLEIYFINQRYSRHSFNKNTIYDAGPQEFLELIKNSDFVCTDSFHGTIFSLIFQKEFYTFIESKQGKDTRRQDLLKNLDAFERCIYLDDIHLSEGVINYKQINKKLNAMRDKSNQFLKYALLNED